ncbi:Calcium-binding mitochondrial carrier protein [Wickerhamomyces ciferrii]|uniref:Calcium-binding mitochondrial carrier protein n=1 Tax=Wickerhamomyces ciferrii (strain ATCC 14091 / BCRC 22168 / CBS 111 / JCM 3599 / NBRC 0793 / NRRL Y-1031 F-60-10) TaxID=1206466 RepID=K0KFQ2_WICCF|nr:Calcium-binding mitochondrial carrier protein [Wickerhamomyces ciferrii]CCH43975.1 Calcium-binding mitochondrial carrier protein [Wickerhamomyces ciferrii]
MAESTKNLRPYYDSETFHAGGPAIYRPGIGVVDEHGNTIASKIVSSSNLKRSINNSLGIGSVSKGFSGNGKSSMKNLIRINQYNENIKKNMYSDLEFSEYFELQNVSELIKSLINSLIKSYLRCLIAQPFEVARLLLQIGDIQTTGSQSVNSQSNGTKKNFNTTNNNDNNEADDDDDDDDDDEHDDEVYYFRSKHEDDEPEPSRRTRTIKRKVETSPIRSQKTPSPIPLRKKNPNHITPVSLNTVDVMSSLLSKEGTRGLWRATNATFIFNALSSTLEAWITGFISPFLQIPDPFFVDVAHSPEPTTTLALSITASILTGLLLAPLDLIKTKLIVSSINNNERSIRNSIRDLKYFTCPISLIIPNILNTLANTIFKKFTPYLIVVKFGIDSYASPVLNSTIGVVSSVLELFVRLPIETLYRRAQVAFLLKKSEDGNTLKIRNEDQLIVGFGGYSGLFKTLFDIYHHPGPNGGIEALFRGWRVGLLNLFGSLGLNFLQQNYDDQSFKEEKF